MNGGYVHFCKCGVPKAIPMDMIRKLDEFMYFQCENCEKLTLIPDHLKELRDVL
jgi:hypothetical protein